MLSKIHPTAVIDDQAVIDENAIIGPYCVIGPKVVIKSGVELKSHVCIEGRTVIDENTVIYPFASIGQAPQDLKYFEEESETYVGKNCIIREYVTIQRGTKNGSMKTVVEDQCLLMVGCHVAHDCLVEMNVIMANYVSLAGHVHVEKHAVIGGHSAIQQFCRIGAHAMIGGMSGVDKDVVPYGLVKGERAVLAGLNLIGLRRFGFSGKEISKLQTVYSAVFGQSEIGFKDSLKLVTEEGELITHFKNFIFGQPNRPFCTPKI
jgi:UDP-N-acetylglucosamine acyltransferase